MAYSQWVGVLKNKIKDCDLITLLISGMWKSDVLLSIYFGSGTNSLWMLCMVIGSILEIFYVFVKMRLRRLTFPTHFNLQAGFCTEHLKASHSQKKKKTLKKLRLILFVFCRGCILTRTETVDKLRMIVGTTLVSTKSWTGSMDFIKFRWGRKSQSLVL